jgi:hypothetical protein
MNLKNPPGRVRISNKVPIEYSVVSRRAHKIHSLRDLYRGGILIIE